MRAKKRMSKLLSTLLAASMVVSMLPVNIFADETTGDSQTTTPVVEEQVQPLADGDALTGDVKKQTVTSAADETIYVLTETLTAGEQYLIVNVNSGSGYALGTSTTGIAVTTATADDNTAYYTDYANGTKLTSGTVYIDDANSAPLWTVGGSSGSYTFTSGTFKLGVTQSSNNGSGSSYPLSFSTSSSWRYNTENNRLSTSVGNSTRYLRYNNDTWGTTGGSSDNRQVYFYKATTIKEVVSTTYHMDVTVNNVVTTAYTRYNAINGATLQLGAAFTPSTPENGTWTFTSSNTAVATVDGSGLVTFTGVDGSTVIQGTYTWGDNGQYSVQNYIVITAVKDTVYTLDIVDPDKENVSITGTITIKEVTSNTKDNLAAVVSYKVSDTESSTVTDPDITWTSNNTSIATVDADGKVHFTGAEGQVQITATYTDPNGNEHSDTVTYSVSQGKYTIPTDGTNDFPTYPNEGAIRFDKNATAVGNFSETGIAQVELAMTGVPYTKGNEIDVVIMIDMSTSMKQSTNEVADRVTPAKDAAIDALNTIVKNTDGSINENRVAIYTFNGYDEKSTTQNYDNAVKEVLSLQTYTTDSLATATGTSGTIATAITESNTGSGTNYAAALKKCHDVLADARSAEDYNRKQFVIFVTDGEPTTGFAYVDADSDTGWTDDGYNSAYNNGAADVYYEKTEYFSTEMKKDGVEVYTVGIQLDNDNAYTILKKIAGNKDGNAYTGGTDYANYAQFIEANGNADDLVDIFKTIVNAIKQAATDITVVDKISEKYSMNFGLPSNVTSTTAGMSEFYIQVVEYTLDANKDRTGTPSVLENFTFNSDGTLKSHTVGGSACGDTCTHVTTADGVITAIDGTYFDYSSTSDGEFLTWTAEKLSTTELALQYFLYLDDSAGKAAADQVTAGTYPTNEYATLTYTNFNGNECQQYFPVPQMTWNGAQVSYVFYLVNSDGQPVNPAGQVVPFAEAYYVTDVSTHAVTWNEALGTDRLVAEQLAQDLVPSVYQLYDTGASYDIYVYETEDGVNLNNHFVIGGTTGVTPNTTYVFNTKAGTKYSAPGTYTASNVYTGFDFANTTVAFAVTWTPALVADTVVIDYGQPVVIDVAANDSLNGSVVGVRSTAPSGVTANSGQYDAAKATTATLTHGIAAVENQTSVRYTPTDMKLNASEVFYYESDVSYYDGDTLKNTSMYSSVTVVPATIIYYEDSTQFVSFSGNWTGTASSTAKQDTDRPGVDAVDISALYDANNVYGYDSAYENCATYSLGSASKATVSKGSPATATFTFTGTGFDVISLTSGDTGTITVDVYAGSSATDTPARSWIVDTYYGYEYSVDTENPWIEYTWKLGTDGKWHVYSSEETKEKGESTYDSSRAYAAGDTFVSYVANEVWTAADKGALYQVPVIKSPGSTGNAEGEIPNQKDLGYGTWTVVITALYGSGFDHKSDGSYDFYLDAIRIYNPAGAGASVTDGTVLDAYIKDKEYAPTFIEIRDQLLAANSLTAGTTATGIVFIDSLAATSNTTDTSSITDYTNYGPNNEVYLMPGQSIAFALNESTLDNIASVQVAAKSIQGTSSTAVEATVTCGTSSKVIKTATATDLYYDITDVVGAGGTVVISNTGANLISLTNLKVTYNAASASSFSLLRTMSLETAEEAADTATAVYLESVDTAVEEEVVEPETPDEEIPEEETPTTSVPEKPSKPGQQNKPDQNDKNDGNHRNDRWNGKNHSNNKQPNGRR